MNFQQLLQSVFQLPQTQKDVAAIAAAAQQAQSPQMQAQLAQVQSDLTAAVGTQLTLQLVSTVALIGIFVLLYRKG